MNDTQSKIGSILTDATKDAIHIAVLPVRAHRALTAGQHIGVEIIGGEHVSRDEFPLGVVDPFVGRVAQGDRFFLFLYPNTVSAMRHEWEHPGVPSVDRPLMTVEASEKWLREFAESHDCPSYEGLLKAALGEDLEMEDEFGYYSYENDGEHLVFYGLDAHGEIPPEFWDHVEVVTGKRIPSTKRATYFSCSC